MSDQTLPQDHSRSSENPVAPPWQHDTLNLGHLATMPAEVPLDAEAMSDLFGAGGRALTRMVQRGELPPPIRIGGRRIWMAGVVRTHLLHRAEEEAKKAAVKQEMKRRHMPHS